MNVTAKVKTLTADEFERDAARARRATESGPVFIVTDGAVSHVLMTKAEFDRLEETAKDQNKSLRAALMHPDGDDFDFEPPKMQEPVFRAAELD